MAGSTSDITLFLWTTLPRIACSGHSVGYRNHGQPTLDVATVLVRSRALSCSITHDYVVKCIMVSSTPAFLPLFRATVLKALLSLTIIPVSYNIFNPSTFRQSPTQSMVEQVVVAGVGFGAVGEGGGEALLVVLTGEAHGVERSALDGALRQDDGIGHCGL